jgi:hypothetical protein
MVLECLEINMDERIKELADSAYRDASDFCKDNPALDSEDTYRLKFQEKFAELIIAECVSVIEKEDRQLEVSNILCKSSTRAAIDKAAQSGGLKVHTKGIVNSVKRHFGVK